MTRVISSLKQLRFAMGSLTAVLFAVHWDS